MKTYNLLRSSSNVENTPYLITYLDSESGQNTCIAQSSSEDFGILCVSAPSMLNMLCSFKILLDKTLDDEDKKQELYVDLVQLLKDNKNFIPEDYREFLSDVL